MAKTTIKKSTPQSTAPQSTQNISNDVEQEGGISKTYQRNMSGRKEIFTDLFKLSPAQVIKYEGFRENEAHPEDQKHKQDFTYWEHTHPFRTYDKKGDAQKYSTPIAGHFHVIEWAPGKNPDDPPVIKSVSGPMVMGKQKIRGRVVQAPVPANDYDFHTHDIEYMRSSKMEFSTTNVEAAKVVAFESSKTAPIPGVTER